MFISGVLPKYKRIVWVMLAIKTINTIHFVFFNRLLKNSKPKIVGNQGLKIDM